MFWQPYPQDGDKGAHQSKQKYVLIQLTLETKTISELEDRSLDLSILIWHTNPNEYEWTPEPGEFAPMSQSTFIIITPTICVLKIN